MSLCPKYTYKKEKYGVLGKQRICGFNRGTTWGIRLVGIALANGIHRYLSMV